MTWAQLDAIPSSAVHEASIIEQILLLDSMLLEVYICVLYYSTGNTVHGPLSINKDMTFISYKNGNNSLTRPQLRTGYTKHAPGSYEFRRCRKLMVLWHDYFLIGMSNLPSVISGKFEHFRVKTYLVQGPTTTLKHFQIHDSGCVVSHNCSTRIFLACPPFT